jgi:hypothetical protein
LCNHADTFGDLAQTILYLEVPWYFTWTPTKKLMLHKQDIPIDAYPGLFESNILGWVFIIQGRLNSIIINCYWLMSPAHCLFKIYVKWMANSFQRINMHDLHPACWKTTTGANVCLL